MSSKSSAQLRGLLYVIVAISVGIVFGRTSEVCDDASTCPSRLRSIIAFGALAFVACIPLVLCTVFEKVPSAAEAGLSTLLVAFTTVGVGIASSVRTLRLHRNLLDLPLGFSWVGEVLAVIAWYSVAIEALVGFKKSSPEVVEEDKGADTTAVPAVETVAPVNV